MRVADEATNTPVPGGCTERAALSWRMELGLSAPATCNLACAIIILVCLAPALTESPADLSTTSRRVKRIEPRKHHPSSRTGQPLRFSSSPPSTLNSLTPPSSVTETTQVAQGTLSGVLALFASALPVFFFPSFASPLHVDPVLEATSPQGRSIVSTKIHHELRKGQERAQVSGCR